MCHEFLIENENTPFSSVAMPSMPSMMFTQNKDNHVSCNKFIV